MKNISKSNNLKNIVIIVLLVTLVSVILFDINFQSKTSNNAKEDKVTASDKSSTKKSSDSTKSNNPNNSKDKKHNSTNPNTTSHIVTKQVDGAVLTIYDSAINVEYEDVSQGITLDDASNLGYLITVDMDKNDDGILDLDLRNGKWTYYNPEGFENYYYIYGEQEALNSLSNQESTYSSQDIDEAIDNDEITYQTWDDIVNTVDF